MVARSRNKRQLKESKKPVLIFVASFWVTHLVQQLLFGLSPTDTATFLLAVGGIVMVALVASYLPARRAIRVDPMVALRDE
jgi:putative ABC transport system permease protein